MSGENDSEIAAPRNSKWSFVFLAFVLCVGFFVRYHHLGTVHSWFDESLGWRMAQFSPAEILTRSERNVHPPMHFLLLSGWRILFGGSLLTLRYYSLVWGMLTIVGGFLLARDVHAQRGANSKGNFAALLAAALIALSPLHIHWSQQVKMYSLGTCLTVWSTWFLIRWFQSGNRWRLTAYVLLAATLSMQHHYGTFTVFGQLTFAIVWSAARSISVKNWNSFLAIFITGWATLSLWALWLPSFLVQRSLVKKGYWIGEFTWRDAEKVWGDLFVAETPLTLSGDLTLIIALTVLAVVLGLLAQRETAPRLIGWLVIIPFSIALAWSLMDQNVFVSRFLINAHICLLVGIAVLVASLPWRWMRDGLTFVLMVSVATTAFAQYEHRTRIAQVPGMPEVISILKDSKADGEPVLVCNPMLYLNLCVHNAELGDRSLNETFAFNSGRRFPHFQGEPVMREDEYYFAKQLTKSEFNWVWTLDADNWLGRSWKVRLPREWELQEERSVQEWYGTLVIRAYRRTDDLKNSSSSAFLAK